MGNPFSKDGAVTRLVEAIPVVGPAVTAPVHAAAGNAAHAARNMVASFSGGVAALVGGPLAAFGANAAVIGVDELFKATNISDGSRQEEKIMTRAFIQAVNSNERPEVRERAKEEFKQRANAAQGNLSHVLAAAGLRPLRTAHGYYVCATPQRTFERRNSVQGDWERFSIENHHAKSPGKVAIKAMHGPTMPGLFFSGQADRQVTLQPHLQDWEYWTPFRNTNGSVSFLSIHGTWLSAEPDGRLTLKNDCDLWEEFWSQ